MAMHANLDVAPGDRHSATAVDPRMLALPSRLSRCQAPVGGTFAMHANPAVALGTDTRRLAGRILNASITELTR